MLRDLIRKLTRKTLSATRTSSGDFLLRKTDFGLVRVEFSVIQKIAERALAQLQNISDAEVTVEKNSSSVAPMKINLTLTLAEGCSAPLTGRAADKAINDAFKDLLQLAFYVPVDVRVRRIAQPVAQTRRRVR